MGLDLSDVDVVVDSSSVGLDDVNVDVGFCVVGVKFVGLNVVGFNVMGSDVVDFDVVGLDVGSWDGLLCCGGN